MDKAELLAAAESLDTDEIADIAADLPHDVIQELLTTLDAQKRAHLQSDAGLSGRTVGALMDFEMVTIRADVDAGSRAALSAPAGRTARPARQAVRGRPGRRDHRRAAAQALLTPRPEASVAAVMVEDFVKFHPEDEASEAVAGVRALRPGVGAGGRRPRQADRPAHRRRGDGLHARVGRRRLLRMAGLKEEEDLFAPPWPARATAGRGWRSIWCTAFIASRVIGPFEGTIEQLARWRR